MLTCFKKLRQAALCLLVLLVADVVPAAEQSLLYVARAPRDRNGFRTLAPSIEVFDINNGHTLIRAIPLDAPSGTARVSNIRGITASAATKTLYIFALRQLQGSAARRPAVGLCAGAGFGNRPGAVES